MHGESVVTQKEEDLTDESTETTGQGRRFNPAEHMRKLAGKEYLEIMWRVLWATMDNEQIDIVTELVELRMGEEPKKTDFALFKAEVQTTKGRFVAYGSETRGDFADFIEKSGTKAVGRALGLAGYGTQFAEDWVFDPNEVGHVVDSPVEKVRPTQLPTQSSAPAKEPQSTNAATVPKPISEKQISLIRDRAAKREDKGATIISDFMEKAGVTKTTMNSRQASQLIDLLAA